MSWGLVSVAAATVIGSGISYLGQQKASQVQADAANQAAQLQAQQYQQTRADLAPYRDQGATALNAANAIAGNRGAGEQQAQIDAIQNGSIFKGMADQANRSILQAQSATGGLRTGTTQDILSQYTPALLNQLINQQFSRQMGLAGIGESAASGTANAGANYANQAGNALQQQAAAQAGGILAGSNTMSNMIQGLGNLPMMSQLQQKLLNTGNA